LKRTIEQIKEIISTRAKKLAGAVTVFRGKSLKLMREHKALTAVIGTAAVLLGAAIFLMYGPYKGLSDLYITTAMHTSDHRYLAEMFYSDEYIAEVLERNAIHEQYGGSDEIIPVEASDGMELHRIEEEEFSGWMLIVDDPARLRVVPAHDYGELLEDIAARYGAVAAINASGYVSNGMRGEPNGLVIIDHQVVHQCEYNVHSFFALTDSGGAAFGTLATESLLRGGFRDVIDFGPVLILNGTPNEIVGDGGGLSARTAIGQTEDGRILMLAVDGLRLDSFGATFNDVQSIMLRYGAVNAVALDGGSSTSMYYDGAIINEPCQGMEERFLPNAIIVI